MSEAHWRMERRGSALRRTSRSSVISRERTCCVLRMLTARSPLAPRAAETEPDPFPDSADAGSASSWVRGGGFWGTGGCTPSMASQWEDTVGAMGGGGRERSPRESVTSVSSSWDNSAPWPTGTTDNSPCAEYPSMVWPKGAPRRPSGGRIR